MARYFKTSATVWNTANNWSATSAGGADNAGVPTAADDVIFELLSGNCQVNTNAVCRSIDTTSGVGTYGGTVTYDTNARTLTIGDATAGAGNVALKLNSGMTYTVSGVGNSITFASTSTTQQSITYGGRTMGSQTFNGSGGKWQLQDSLTATGATITVTTGTVDTNGQAVAAASVVRSGSSALTLTLGASAITLSLSGNAWNVGSLTTNFTMSANTATVTLTGTDSVFSCAQTFNYNGMTLVFSGAGTQVLGNAGGAPTFANLTRTGTAVKTDVLSVVVNVTCTSAFTVTSNSLVNRVLVASSVRGTTRTITAASLVATNVVDFMDITGAGAATWTTAASGATGFGDCGGNSGITFTGATTRYGVVAGSWSNTATWSTSSGGAGGASVPLPQDTVILNGSSAAGTYTNDMPRPCADLTCTGFTRTLTFGSVTTEMYGSLTLASGMTWTSSISVITLAGRGTHTITCATKTILFNANRNLVVNGPGGTYTAQDTFTTTGSGTGTVAINGGTFDAGNQAINVFPVVVAAGAAIVMGSGTWTVTGVTGGGSAWSASATSTVTANTSTIVLAGVSASTRTFAGGGKTYNNLSYVVAGSTGGLDLTGSNSFSTFSFSDATNARTLRFTAGTTTTITTDFVVDGFASNLVTIGSITAASHTIAMPTGVSCDYLSISRSTLTGNDAYAGANSTDGGNNSTSPGWIFTAPPAGGSTKNFALLGVG